MPDKLAIHGGTPIRTKPFPAWPVFGESEERALIRALKSGKWGKQDGRETTRFEKRFADYHGAAHGIAVVNGTVAIRIALMAAGIKAGDEVIVPPYTFIATASAVIEANAIPVFADLERDTFNIDPHAVEAALTNRTRAIIPVHFGGLPVKMDEIMDIAQRHNNHIAQRHNDHIAQRHNDHIAQRHNDHIAQRHNLVVIEDACHAHGAMYKGRRVGGIGDMGVFSFQSSKNMTSGEGGIILTNNSEFAGQCRSIHNCGREAGHMWYEHFRIGGNYRLGEFQSAVLNTQFERLEQQAETRERNGVYLAEKLKQIPGIMPQARDGDCTRHAFHLFSLRIDEEAFGWPRKLFLEALAAEGVPASAGYAMPIYRQRLFEEMMFGPYTGYSDSLPGLNYHNVTCPNCEKICEKEGIWIEQRLLLGTKEDMDDIVRAFEKIGGAKK